MTAAPSSGPESLLAHDDFVRGLARQLLRDPALADDVAQQTWLAWLGRTDAGRAPQALRAFLATLVRRLCGRERRQERRERARRLAVASSTEVPSAADVMAREAQRTRVVQAVLALPAPYRDVVVLRFFEQLPPRAIARRLQVPVETVRTRQKRALAQLRSRLDDGAGGRAAWAAPLAWFVPRTPVAATVTSVASSVSRGVLLMSVQAKLVAVFAVVAALLCVAWPLWSKPPAAQPAPIATPPAGLVVTAAEARAEQASTDAAIAADPAMLRRQSANGSDSGAAATASLQVTVLFADEQPAADVVVTVRRSGVDNRTSMPPRGRTDATGRVTFEDLAPGRMFPRVYRGQSRSGDAVVLVAGRRAEAVVRLERGMDLRGIVVDRHDRPVAGAAVVVGDWTGSEVDELGVTAADGTFVLRAIATHCNVGARGAGFAPSPLRQFTANEGAAVETRIVLETAGVALRGTVVDGAGRPVAAAIVRAGDFEQRSVTLPDGAHAMGWRPVTTCSDERGAFAFADLPAQRLPLAVVARGQAPWRGDVDVQAGRQNQVAVVLAAGASLRGRVCDATGQPVARADLELGRWEDLGHRRARTGDDGTFLLEDLVPGNVEVTAESEAHGRARATLALAAGQVTTWEPRLHAVRLLRGRVLDPDGAPVAAVQVQGSAPTLQTEPWWAVERTDAEGRFQLKNCPDRPLRLELLRRSSFPELVVEALTASNDELVLTLPKEAWIHIIGSIHDPDGAPVPNVHVAPSKHGGHSSPAETADATTGGFRLGPYPPGRYSVRFEAGGFVPITRTQDVAGDSTWDLGALRFQRGGFVVLAPQSDDAELLASATFVAVADEGGDRHLFQEQAGRLRAGPLAAGAFRLLGTGERLGAMSLPFTVVEGRETVLDVPLQRGQRAVLAARVPRGTAGAIVEFAVDDAEGHRLGEPAAYLTDGVATVPFGLLPGRYTITAKTAGFGGRASLEVTVGGKAAEVRIDLQPQ